MTHETLPHGLRPATSGDLDEMTRILTAAFLDDPVWGPSFPDVETRPQVAGAYWRFMVGQALRFSESRVLERGSDGEGTSQGASTRGALRAVSVWYPPGEDEISVEDHAAYDALVSELLDPEAAAAVEQAGARFADARPSDPHAYLTLLGVAPEARGGGHGMALLRAALAHYDDAGISTYLESSNPANDARYERLGYRPRAVVELVGGVRVQTYWRDPRGARPAV
ncbi:N-acetyltransferase [Microbacterium sp. OVT16B]|uniref:GNAT family N-acetyltransferase n=1 Tax=Microbacterium sp. OVT16B TaxID=2862682 RepID=UPI001CC067FC|nr:GNAT family N-acetyltransferase [Microbacterium sp. OVT16B]